MRDSGPLLIVRPPKDRTPHVCGSVEPSLAPSCRGVAYGVPRARSQRHSPRVSNGRVAHTECTVG